MAMPGRGTRSLDLRRHNLAGIDRRRSSELSRSTRRYDEHWGSAEKTDTRLKCGDGTIHHVHSQVISCWSPVLRDMVALYPPPQLLESWAGPAYLLHVEEEAAVWAAALDRMYPVPQLTQLDWPLLEGLLLLADKYDMAVLLARAAAELLAPARHFSMDPAAPNFALRWQGLAERLQLHEVAARIQAFLKPSLAELGSQPAAMSAVLAYAQEHCSKEQLLQLLQLSMQAATQQQAVQQQQQQPAWPSAQQQGVVPSISFVQQGMQPLQRSQLSTPAASGGSLAQGQATPPQAPSWPAAGAAPPAAAASSCSGSSGAGASLSDDASSGDAAAAAAAAGAPQDAAMPDSEQRLALCLSSGLFAPAQLPARPPLSPAASFGGAKAASASAAPVFAMTVDARVPVPGSFGFGFGVNGGSASIADWMRSAGASQSEAMVL